MLNPVVIKIFTLAVMTIYSLSIMSITKNRKIIYFTGLLAVHLLKDIIFVYYPLAFIPAIGNVSTIFFLALWIRDKIDESSDNSEAIFPDFLKLFFYYNIVIILILSILGSIYYYFSSQVPTYTIVLNNNILFNSWALANIAYVFYVLDKIHLRDIDEFENINSLRNIIVLFLSFPVVLNYFLSYQHNLMQLFIVPASYILYAVIIFYHQRTFIEEKNFKISYLTDQVDSLFNFMKEMGDVIRGHAELEHILKKITDSAIENISADSAAIIMLNEESGLLEVKAVTGYFPPPYETDAYVSIKRDYLDSFFRANSIPLKESIFERVINTSEPTFIKDAGKDDLLKHNHQEGVKLISSIIMLPIKIGHKTSGVFAAVKTQKHKLFSGKDFSHAKIFMSNASITIENFYTYLELLEKHEIEKEIGIAGEIQRNLIPEKIPDFDGISIAAFTKAAKGVSGDYYDIHKLNEEKIAIVICDVAGKGVPASLVMVMIRSIFRLIASPKKTAGELVSWINRGLSGNVSVDRYATMSVVVYDQNDKNATYSNAAHFPMLIYREKDSKLEEVDTQGLPVGIEAKGTYGQKRVKFESGDIIIFCTDGITEAVNTKREQYGLEKFKEMIIENSSKSCQEIIDNIVQDINKFVGRAKQHDDQTLMVMKIK